VGFGVSGAESSESATGKLRWATSSADCREVGDEGGRWMELAQRCVFVSIGLCY
jgi:hypothetical protein